MQGRFRRILREPRGDRDSLASGKDYAGLVPPEGLLKRITEPGSRTEICGPSGKTRLAVQAALHACSHPLRNRVLYNVPSRDTQGVQRALQALTGGTQPPQTLVLSAVQDWAVLGALSTQLEADLVILDETPGMEPPRPTPAELEMPQEAARIEIHPDGLSGQANLETGIVLRCTGDHLRIERLGPAPETGIC